MRTRPGLGGVAAAALLLALGACASAPETVTGSAGGGKKGSPRGVYKIGNPYQIMGVWYYPKEEYDYRETGIASWYGSDFHGKSTANGETYDMNDLTAAHRTLPLPSIVRVTNLENGRSMTLRVNDRGPFARSRIIDISRRGAQLLGFERQGTAKVRVEIMAAESEQLAQIYRGSPTIGQALARTPSLPDPSAPPTAVAALPAASPPSVASSGGGGTGDVISLPGLAPLPASAPAPVAIAPQALPDTPPLAATAPTVTAMTIEQVPLPPPAAAAVPARRPPPPLPPALAAVVAEAPQTGAVSVEPVRTTQIYVQAGAFSQRANADRVRQTISGQAAAGIAPVRVTTVAVGGGPVHRVRVGPLRSVEAADQALARVASAGYPEARIIVE
ncbi:hypothetical protein STVA_29540 [Allostella vacuolata]|nr:hypothetical protein STVA_29540 [Stella vacuolata]